MTLNEIILTFEQVSQYMLQINSFEFGDNLEQNEANTKYYPQLFLEAPILQNNINGANVYQLAYNILDRPVEDDNWIHRRAETLSNCGQILEASLKLILDQLKNWNTSVRMNNCITIIDQQADNLTGVRCELTIETPLRINQCEIQQDPNFTQTLEQYLNSGKICP